MSPLPQHALRLGRGSLPLLRGTPSATLAKEHTHAAVQGPSAHSPPTSCTFLLSAAESPGPTVRALVSTCCLVTGVHVYGKPS